MAQSNLPPCESNQWTWTDCNGTITTRHFKYVGEFKNGKRNGQGTWTDAYGNKYVGEFMNDERNGQGIEFNADGSIQRSGIYEAGNFVRAEVIDPAIFTRIQQEPNQAKSKQVESVLPACEEDLFHWAVWQDCFGTATFTSRHISGGGLPTQDATEQRKAALSKGSWSKGYGDTYVGEWMSGKFQGTGTYLNADGTLIASGVFDAGKLVRSHVADPLVVARIKRELDLQTANTQTTENERPKTEAEQAKSRQAELETQLAAAQPQTQIKPTAQIAPQGKRVALVIGNAKYKFNPLNNPVNDATDMAASLRSVGFDVIEIRDANKRQMRAATRRFEDKLAASDVGLVYYSGHGVEVKGRNYLIPVDADIRREHEVEDQAFDAGNILRMMESLQGTEKKRVNIMIVDACRNNDLARSWRSTNRGLARMDAPAGSFISFATAPGQVASDGQGRNSPYTKHLLNALKQPNVPIEQVFKQVRRNVMDETGGEQVPWENSSLVGDFYFAVAR